MSILNRSKNPEVLKGFLEAGLFCSDDNEEIPLDRNYNIDNFSKDAIKNADAVIQYFIDQIPIGMYSDIYDGSMNDLETLGNDLYLSMTHQGSGFWDGDWGDFEDDLMKAVKITQKRYPIETCMLQNDGTIGLY